MAKIAHAVCNGCLVAFLLVPFLGATSPALAREDQNTPAWASASPAMATIVRPLPISADPAHPANTKGRTVYLARTGVLQGKSREQQARIVQAAMLAAGPAGRLEMEIEGSRGNYLDELGEALLEARKRMQAQDRPLPRLSALFSGARPGLGTELSNFARALDSLDGAPMLAAPGTLGVDGSQDVIRDVLNWGNDRVFEAYKHRLTSYLDWARTHDIPPDVTVDDHFSVLPSLTGSFMRVNGISSELESHALISARLAELAQVVRRAGGKFTLSINGDFDTAAKMGVLPQAVKPDALEFQIYRDSSSGFLRTLRSIERSMRQTPHSFVDLHEVRIAVTTRANGHEVPETSLREQQKLIVEFALKLKEFLNPDIVVSTSLWHYGTFYRTE